MSSVRVAVTSPWMEPLLVAINMVLILLFTIGYGAVVVVDLAHTV